MYKLIALDIDGTLLNPQGVISPRVKTAITKAVAAGCTVTLATGRRLKSARRLANELQIPVPIILYSGSLVYDLQTETALFHRALPADFVRTMVGMLCEIGLSPGLLQSPLGGENIVLGPPEHDNDYLRDYATHADRAPLIMRQAFNRLHEIPHPMVVIAPGSKFTNEYLRENLRPPADFPFYFHSYRLHPHTGIDSLWGHDFFPPDYNKGVALAWLAEQHGLTLEQTIAIGDGTNDIDMLRAAGLGVAMQNAEAQVQAAVKLICPPNSEDGVAWVIENYVLNQ